MKKRILCSILFVATYFNLSCITGNSINQQEKDTSLFVAGTVPQLISRQFGFTEGPAADDHGNVYFTDQPNNAIWKYDTNGKLSLFSDSAGRSNGLYFDKKGNLIACADEQNQLWRIDDNGTATVLLNDIDGKKLNGPNDVWVHPSGYIYFTDPYYQRPYWTRKETELDGQHVYLLAGKIGTVSPVIKNLKQPNGIIGTPDGKWLYVADIGAWKTYKYGIKKDGTLSEGALFADMGSDGMTIDERGNVYLTGNGITVFNPKGQQIAHIPIPEKWTANITFGGRDRKQLFITASEAIYIMNMNVMGVN